MATWACRGGVPRSGAMLPAMARRGAALGIMPLQRASSPGSFYRQLQHSRADGNAQFSHRVSKVGRVSDGHFGSALALVWRESVLMGCWCEWRAPRRLRYVPPAVVFVIIGWLYGSFVRFAQPQLLLRGTSIIEIAALHGMVLLLCASLAQCLVSTDSFVSRRPKGEKPPSDNVPVSLIEMKANGGRRFCRRCNVWKADRMHHCSSCKRCVLKMDHHCVYINKCIGYHNYKFFLQFLGWSSLACLHLASLIFRFLLLDHLDHTIALFFRGRLRFWSPSLQVSLVFFVGGCLGLALLCFHLMHVVLMSFNYTTLEYCEKRRDGDYINLYNVGVLGNLEQVLGSLRELPYWFVPLPTPSSVKRGGKSFPLSMSALKTQ